MSQVENFESFLAFNITDMISSLLDENGARLYQCARRCSALEEFANGAFASRPTKETVLLVSAADQLGQRMSQACFCLGRCEGTPHSWRKRMAQVMKSVLDELGGVTSRSLRGEDYVSVKALDAVEEEAWKVLDQGENPMVVLNFLMGLYAWRDVCEGLALYLRRRNS